MTDEELDLLDQQDEDEKDKSRSLADADEIMPSPRDPDQPRSIAPEESTEGSLGEANTAMPPPVDPALKSITGMSNSPVTPPKSITASPLEGSQPLSASQATTPPAMAPRPAADALEKLREGQAPISKKHGIGGGFLKALEIAGTILTPNAMAAIPGTRANYAMQTRNAQGAANEEGKIIGDQGTEGKNQSEENLQGAEAENLRSETKARENPADWKAIGDPVVYNGSAYQPRINGRTGQTELAPLQIPGAPAPQPGAPTAGAAPVAGGTQPTPAAGAGFTKLGAPEQNQPIGDSGAAQHTEALNTLTGGMSKADKTAFLSAFAAHPNDTTAVAAKRLEDAKAAAQMSGAERDRKITEEATAQNRRQVENDKQDAATRSEVDKAHSTISKALDKADDQLEKLRTAASTVGGASEMGDALGVVKTLVASAGGQGSGVRVTQAELERIAKARGWAGSIDAFFEHAAGYGTLTPEQRDQVKGILKDITEVVQQRRDILSDADDKVLGAGNVDEVRNAQKELVKKMGGRNSSGGGGEAPEGTRVKMVDGSFQVKKNGKWQPE